MTTTAGDPIAAVDRTFFDVTVTPAPNYYCGATLVPTRGQGLAVQSWGRIKTGFAGYAWLSGDDERLVRVQGSAVPFQSAPPGTGPCIAPSLSIQYVRVPDTTGTNATTPGGRSLNAGGP